MPTLLLATTNPGKVREFRHILAQFPDVTQLHIVTPREVNIALPPVDETGDTFAANAVLKARSACAVSGLPALADDSGLCVDALNGAPGLLSARWAGPNATDADRTVLLLATLSAVPDGERSARFICAAALALPDGPCIVEEGVCEGQITRAPRGTNGFGYDPVFFLPTFERTLAQLSDAEKNAISHRALALRHLLPHFLTILA